MKNKPPEDIVKITLITSTPAPLLLKEKGPGDEVFRVNSPHLGMEFGSRAFPGVLTN